MHAVHIEEIEERPYANDLVRGPTGEHNIKARLGEGLFAALRSAHRSSRPRIWSCAWG